MKHIGFKVCYAVRCLVRLLIQSRVHSKRQCLALLCFVLLSFDFSCVALLCLAELHLSVPVAVIVVVAFVVVVVVLVAVSVAV